MIVVSLLAHSLVLAASHQLTFWRACLGRAAIEPTSIQDLPWLNGPAPSDAWCWEAAPRGRKARSVSPAGVLSAPEVSMWVLDGWDWVCMLPKANLELDSLAQPLIMTHDGSLFGWMLSSLDEMGWVASTSAGPGKRAAQFLRARHSGLPPPSRAVFSWLK